MRFQTGDADINYIDVGRGEPVVLLMGLGADHTAGQFQIRPFAERYRVIALDNRDSGATTHTAESYSTRTLANDVLALLTGIGVERAHVIGVSLGGLIGQELALAAPARVATLALHSTLARADAYLVSLAALWASMRRHLPLEDFVRAMMLWMFSPRTFATRPEFIAEMTRDVLSKPDSLSPAGFARQLRAVLAHDTLDRLGDIRCPTLITAGADDILVPPPCSRPLQDAIPDCQFTLFEGAGHGVFLEAAHVFNEACLTFFEKHRLDERP